MKKPVILITNDDGIYAAPIAKLKEKLSGIGEVYVVAPDRDKSGASQSLTLSVPLYLNWISATEVAVQGTPADCTHLALNGLLPQCPDLVISGINLGYNLGDDVFYSGTVAAALEANTCGVPSIAFSAGSSQLRHLDSIVGFVVDFIVKMLAKPIDPNIVLNVNIPDSPATEINGIVTTVLGRRLQSSPMVLAKSPRNKDFYWIGKVGEPKLNSEGTDFSAVASGYISVTPLHMDMTKHDALSDIESWVKHS